MATLMHLKTKWKDIFTLEVEQKKKLWDDLWNVDKRKHNYFNFIIYKNMKYYNFYDELQDVCRKYRGEIIDDKELRKVYMMEDIIQATNDTLERYDLL